MEIPLQRQAASFPPGIPGLLLKCRTAQWDTRERERKRDKLDGGDSLAAFELSARAALEIGETLGGQGSQSLHVLRRSLREIALVSIL